jgi:maltose O-acetyltransferase
MRAEDRIRAGLVFSPADPELKAIKRKAHKLSQDYNKTYEDEVEIRSKILSSLLGEMGSGTFFQGPITFHYGTHTKVGKNCFFNFNLTVQDDADVTIGDRCNFGPNVTIVTPHHPMIAKEREYLLDEVGNRVRLCWAKPVVIGNDCWFGANVVVCPGVTIGNGCVIGAGSVVTRDVPANCFAAGNPARVIREIGEADSMKYKPEILAEYRVDE